MKRVILIAIISLIMIGLFAASQTQLLAKSAPTRALAMAGDTMRTANQLYEQGQYDRAAQAYEQLVVQGYSDGALFYNVGNAYYKQGEYGRAILNYRRAQRLAPRDPDIQANLELVRSLRVDQLELDHDGGLLLQLGEAVRRTFTLNQLAMTALASWIVMVFLLLLFGSAKPGSGWRKGSGYGLAVAATLLLAGVLALGAYGYADHSDTEGVIVVEQVEVTSGPGAQYVTEFTLHSGAEVDLIETRGSWARLVAAGGELEGWVPVGAVEPVSG